MKLLIILMIVINRIGKIIATYLTAFFGSIYIFTVGWLFKRNRALIKIIHDHLFPSADQMLLPIIPKVRQEELLDNNAPVTLHGLRSENGNVTLTELTVISNIVKSSQPKTVFEFGTFNGRTTLNLAANAPEGAVVYTLDLPRENVNKTQLRVETDDKLFIEKAESGTRYKSNAHGMVRARIIQLYGDPATFDFSSYENTIDFVFVDASHSYDYTLNDSKKALKLLRNGKGIILWHDYEKLEYWPGLMKALNELFKQDAVFQGLKHIEGTSLVYLKRV